MAAPCEINIPRQNEENKLNYIKDCVETVIKLGYDIVVINNRVEDLKGKKACMKEKEHPVLVKTPDKILMDEDWLQQLGTRRGRRVQQLSRCTTVVSDAAQTHKLRTSAEIHQYDILAVQPTNEKTFAQACSTLTLDIISLDLTQKLPFHIKRQQTGTAIERGVYFEIQYSPAIRDAYIRKTIISNAHKLMNVIKGKNIIISSGCEKASELRGPMDVMNLAQLFGLTPSQAKEAITTNCRRVIMHAKSRKCARNGVLSIMKTSSLITGDMWKVHNGSGNARKMKDETSESDGEEECVEEETEKLKDKDSKTDATDNLSEKHLNIGASDVEPPAKKNKINKST